MKLGSVLIVPAAALKTAAAVLRLFAGTGELIADLLSPDTPAAVPGHAAPARTAAAPRRPSTRTVDPTHLDVAALASRTAPEVVAALDSMGTAELTDLYEHESRHRRRRAVLDAITAATAPPPSATDDVDLALLDDVRVPDELVYSTESTPH